MTLLYAQGFEGFSATGNRTALDPNFDFTENISTDDAGLETSGRDGDGRNAFVNETSAGGSPPDLMILSVGGLSSDDEWIVGFAFRSDNTEFENRDTRMPVICFRDSEGDEQVRVYARAGTLSVRVGQTGTLLGVADLSINSKVWYFGEVKVNFHASAGSVVMKVHEQEVLNLTGINTASTGTGQTRPFEICFAGSDQKKMQVDDIYICDSVDATATQGRPYNDFLGDNSLKRLSPTADGSVEQWTLSTGADSFALVDEDGPNGDTDYIESQTASQVTLFGFENLSKTPQQVEALVVHSYAKKTDAGSRTFTHRVLSGATGEDGATIAPATDYQFHQSIFTDDPDAADRWDETSINAVEAGVKLVA